MIKTKSFILFLLIILSNNNYKSSNKVTYFLILLVIPTLITVLMVLLKPLNDIQKKQNDFLYEVRTNLYEFSSYISKIIMNFFRFIYNKIYDIFKSQPNEANIA